MWTSRWVRVAGYAALLKIVVVCGWRGAMPARHEWPAKDRRGLVRVIGFSIIPAMGITVLLELTPLMQSLNSRSVDARVVLILIPQALAIAVPVGVMLGILFGLRDRVLSRRLSTSDRGSSGHLFRRLFRQPGVDGSCRKSFVSIARRGATGSQLLDRAERAQRAHAR